MSAGSRRGVPALVAALLVALAPHSLSGQGWTGTHTIETPAWAEAMYVDTRPAAPLVGVAVAYPAGSGTDASGLPGVGRAAAEAVVIGIEERMGAGQAEGRAQVEPDRTLLTFLVRPERVTELLDVVGSVTGSPLDEAWIRTSLERRAAVLRFEVDSPVLEADAERRALLYGEGDPRVRPPGGILAVVEGAITPSEIDVARRALFGSGAHVAAVGAVIEEAAEPMAGRLDALPPPVADTLETDRGDAPTPDSVPTPLPPPSADPAPPLATVGPPWATGDRRVVYREVTNSWITVAYPVPAGLPRIAVLYLADRMDRSLNAHPPDPGLFNASAEVAELPAGEAIVVRAAVLPEATRRFEARMLDLPRDLALERDPTFFRFHRSRFRASRLIREAAPEVAAERMAVELLVLGAVLDLDDAVWSLDAATAADAAAALGDPRILVFGPDLGN